MKHEWRFDPNALTTPTVDKLIRHFMAEHACWLAFKAGKESRL